MIENPLAKSADGIKIPYADHKGSMRNYFPDFCVGDLIIEIKPKRLLQSANNCKKFEAAKQIFGDKFQVLTEKDTIQLTSKDIKFLVDNGDVKFIDRYQIKYKALIENPSDSIL